jgi:hypothetical protein
VGIESWICCDQIDDCIRFGNSLAKNLGTCLLPSSTPGGILDPIGRGRPVNSVHSRAGRNGLRKTEGSYSGEHLADFMNARGKIRKKDVQYSSRRSSSS